MTVTKHLYLVSYKVPYFQGRNWYTECILLYAKDPRELEETISTLPAQKDPTKMLIQAEKMPHGFTIMHSFLPPTIDIEEEIPPRPVASAW